jgi:hypothetical protein
MGGKSTEKFTEDNLQVEPPRCRHYARNVSLSLVSSAVGIHTHSSRTGGEEREISLSIHVVCNKYALYTHTHTRVPIIWEKSKNLFLFFCWIRLNRRTVGASEYQIKTIFSFSFIFWTETNNNAPLDYIASIFVFSFLFSAVFLEYIEQFLQGI